LPGIFIFKQSSVLDRTSGVGFGTGESEEEDILEIVLDVLLELELEDSLLQRGDTSFWHWFEGDQRGEVELVAIFRSRGEGGSE
jgi:hypothetical protein